VQELTVIKLGTCIAGVLCIYKYIIIIIIIITELWAGCVYGIATGYGLDGPGIECRWGRDFPHLYRPALGPTQSPVQWVPGLSWG